MTGMMAQTGSLGQPLLIPLSMAGSIGGQGGLAVLTLPTTNVATLPAFAAANAAGNLLKLPFAGLQGTTQTQSNSSILARSQLLTSKLRSSKMDNNWIFLECGFFFKFVQTFTGRILMTPHHLDVHASDFK